MGKDEVRAFYAAVFAACDSPQLDVHEALWDGTTAAIRFTMSRRHVDEFMGAAASGNDIALPGITILDFEGARVGERFSQADMLRLMVQGGDPGPSLSAGSALGLALRGEEAALHVAALGLAGGVVGAGAHAARPAPRAPVGTDRPPVGTALAQPAHPAALTLGWLIGHRWPPILGWREATPDRSRMQSARAGAARTG
jgi:hypothetical protein